MDAFFAKLKNFWYYYKVPSIIGLVALLMAAWLGVQSGRSPDADYHIGLISTTPRSEEALEALKAGIAAAGEDQNGDGEILVKLHTYYVDLEDDDPNAGVNNADKIAALDADLIGNVSGLFLMEVPESLQSATNGLLLEPYLPYKDGLYLCIRTDAQALYQALYHALENS